ncbi:arginase family protein [Paracoccus aminophilus]|uniref:Arginase n=1 Tax=Paracoccus aminophilus JCM 7686 TaxID=1367847 RepID=S5YYV5_PARAH|nr:arginase family protein [Paracoccus aminophilus]AGT10401.1 hypothetical protein JCM7686_3366 [Paracoccus aminophilus JCM 7686]
MRLQLLHLDDALTGQPHFLARAQAAGAETVEAQELGRLLRLWGRPGELQALKARLAAGFRWEGERPPLTFYGSGDFHHVAALLLELALDHEPGPVTLLHFDNHPDWVHFTNGMHCGSWVNRALTHPKLAKVVTLGVCSDDLTRPEWKGANLAPLREGRLELFPYAHAPSRVRKSYGAGAGYEQQGKHLYWRNIADEGAEAFLPRLLDRIETEAIYITLDKDVLRPADAVTNWDQGQMSLDELTGFLRALGARHRIIGADVTGDYARPDYAGGLFRRLSKRAEILIDQPRRREAPEAARALNESVNLTLLTLFSEIMA